jgi:hypothetical protein
MRARARQAGVVLRADERFGFSAYANEAPEAGRLADVLRERQVVQYLMEALLAAQPRQLLAVQRERPRGPSEPAASGAVVARPVGAGAADYFEMDPRVSARVPGLVDATAFRLSFVGRTAALRSLLNKLAEFELPVVVRAVEVAPAESTPEGVTAAPPGGAASPIARPWSRFTVTVEYIDLVSPPAKTA